MIIATSLPGEAIEYYHKSVVSTNQSGCNHKYSGVYPAQAGNGAARLKIDKTMISSNIMVDELVKRC
ncbi:MAG: hypothetical protein ABRQ29_10210, partial [Smithellaceae bacterium]